MKYSINLIATPLLALGVAASTAYADDSAMMTGLNGFSTNPVFSVGEDFDGYFPPGLLDGMFAYDRGEEVYLLVNHEIASGFGPAYELANGTILTGARISNFVVDKDSRAVIDAVWPSIRL